MSRRPRLLITAGPTHEPIDAVRYLGNRSSGRMGMALTQAALDRGLNITLLLGPTLLPEPSSSRLTVIRFQTAAELENLLGEHWPSHDVLIMAAAVADYRPRQPVLDGKRRRGEANMAIELEPTPDLLAALAAVTRADQTVIGFALEPAAELAASASEKLRRKRLDAIVGNPIETLESDRVSATLFLTGGRVIPASPNQTKAEFACWLLDQIPTMQCKSPGTTVPGLRG